MINWGTVPLGSVLPFHFGSYDGATGASEAISGLAVTDIEIYKGTTVTQRSSDAGYALIDTDGIDIDGMVGANGFSVDTGDNTDAGFFVAGSYYVVWVSSITADGQTVNFIAGTFRLGAAEVTTGKNPVTVAAGDLANSSITAAVIATGAIDADAIADNAIDAGAIAADAITAAKIADGAIDAATFAASAITSTVLADNAITAAKINAAAITSAKFAAGAIDAAALASDAVTEIQTGLSTLDAAAVNAEVVDALNTDTYAEPGQGNPAATTTLVQKIGFLYKAWRNKSTQTASEYALYADDGATKDQEAAVSDDATTFTRNEVQTGA
jgi:hypothetical protein